MDYLYILREALVWIITIFWLYQLLVSFPFLAVDSNSKKDLVWKSIISKFMFFSKNKR